MRSRRFLLAFLPISQPATRALAPGGGFWFVFVKGGLRPPMALHLGLGILSGLGFMTHNRIVSGGVFRVLEY